MATDQEKFANKTTKEGAWKREPTKFHDRISAAPGAKYPAEAGRYHLYVSYACPWAHRTLITRSLLGLESCISVTVTGWLLKNILPPEKGGDPEKYRGWEFIQTTDKNSVFYDPVGKGKNEFLDDIYELAHPGYKQEFKDMGKRASYTVPVLFDLKTNTIVSNESAEIIVMLSDEFKAFHKPKISDLNLNHPDLKEKMEEVNAIIYPGINDGVYRCGAAQTQEAYEEAYDAHWKAMEDIESRLGKSTYLTGETVTLADIRLFVTLIRYDNVYFAHFKTSKRKIRDMPNMYRFLKKMYNLKGVKETVNNEHMVKHYFGSHLMINPTGIWPKGPLEKDSLAHLEI